ncbi:MAG: helix-turn-helix domain-containing protein [Pseudomonadota bacterium]
MVDMKLPDPTERAEGQFPKSTVTRTAILESATDFLARHGYSRFSLALVAAQAGLSRAALVYHFPTRAELIQATIYYVTRRRIEDYAEAMGAIADSPHMTRIAIDVARAELSKTPFLAFAELSAAARSDADLESMFAPALMEYDRARRRFAEKLFPPDTVNSPVFDLKRDILRYLQEGFAQQGGLSFDAAKRERDMEALLQLLMTTPEGDALLRRAVKNEQN